MTHRLLVVEDDPSLLALLQVVLESDGFVVHPQSNGLGALNALNAGLVVDGVLLDWMLPDLDGMAVLGFIRGKPETRGLPVTMLTAKDAADDEVHALTCGADMYVRKPFDPEMLVVSLQLLLADAPEERGHRRLVRLEELNAA